MGVGYEPGLVSVIIPTYNRLERLRRAIASVHSQTYLHWQLIVVDDGSSDGTAEALAEMVGGDKFVALTVTEHLGAPEICRNRGLTLARGQYVAFLDDDDIWLPEKLAQQVRLLEEHPAVCLVHSGVIDFYEDGRRLVRLPPRDSDSYAANLVRDGIATSSVIVRRSTLDATGAFDEDIHASGDWELWTRIMSRHPVRAIETPLALTEQWDGSITHQRVEPLARYRMMVIHRRWRDIRRFGLGKTVIAYHQAFIGGLLLQTGQRKQARRRAVRSMKLNPSSRAAIVFLLSFLPRDSARTVWRQLQRGRRLLRL